MTSPGTPEGRYIAACAMSQTGGAVIVVIDPDSRLRARIDLPDWETFRPASAGHRLIEHGYMMLRPMPPDPDRIAGWLPVPDIGYVAVVAPVDDVLGPLRGARVDDLGQRQTAATHPH